MLKRSCLFTLAMSLPTDIVVLSPAIAEAENLLPVQTALTQQIQAIPDPPPPTSDPIDVVLFEFDPFGTHLVSTTVL